MDPRPLIQKLELGDYFLLGIVVLQFFAVVAYVWKRRWLDATVYACYMTAQIALLLLSMRGRP